MLLLGEIQKKHPGDLPHTVPDLPPPSQTLSQAITNTSQFSSALHIQQS